MLKYCPFCGKTKLKIEYKTDNKKYIKGKKYKAITGSMRCNCCHARGPTITIAYDSKEVSMMQVKDKLDIQLEEAWNNRA